MTRRATCRSILALSAALAASMLAGCDLDLERMIQQPRYSSYEECPACPDGTIMMQPPLGSVARQPAAASPAVASGRNLDGTWVERIPIPLGRPVLERGRSRFDIFCAACHGRLANGLSQVAENMSLRLPPSLVEPPRSDYPAGRVYAAATEGYGLMRSYAAELSVADRWAVVAYVQALAISQSVPLAELPAAVREEARSWLR